MLKNSLNVSKTHSNLEAIFSFTEVNSKRSLPAIKSNSSLRGYASKLKPSENWELFLKSTKQIGNLSPREISESTKEIISNIEEKTKHEFSAVPKTSTNRMSYFSREIDDFKATILHKKSVFNKLHYLVRKKQAALAGLIDKLEELNSQEEQKNEDEILAEKTLEFGELESGLKNEIGCKETLQYMAGRLKTENNKLTQPLIEIRKKLSEIKQEIVLAEKLYFQVISDTSELDRKYEQGLTAYNCLVFQHKEVVKEKSKRYEERLKLQLSIDQEKKKNISARRCVSDQSRLRDLEHKINEYKLAGMLEEEVLSFDKYCFSEEEKFKTIQRVTSVNSVEEVLTNYQSIMVNKRKMLDDVRSCLEHIDKLSLLQKGLKEELTELRYSKPDIRATLNKDISLIQSEFQIKGKKIEKFEVKIEKIEMIIVYAINTFSKVSEMLGLGKKYSKLRKENVLDCMNACITALDTLRLDKKNLNEPSSISSDLSLSESIRFNE